MEKALAFLRKSDPVLDRLIPQAGGFTLETKKNHFGSLCQAIIFQQLSMKAAAGIYNRFTALHRGKITPKKTLAMGMASLREAGLSERKAHYIHDLAAKFMDGTIDAGKFSAMSDGEIIAGLTKVRGVGEWTAHMFLIFSLGRLDVLPMGDLGFRRAVKEAYGLREMPNDGHMLALSEKWRPYRTIATWYLWKSADRGVEY